jgi:acetoacetyl-CoA reductase
LAVSLFQQERRLQEAEMSRLALVTGGERGIGAAIARALKQDGHRVAVTYHGNEAAAEGFRRETGIPAYRWDVADYESCEEGVARVTGELGGAIEILVNNAGITKDGMFHKSSPDQWRAVIDCDLGSCFNMTRAVIGPMREAGFGRVISISSINGQKGQVGQVNYAAAKAGVIGFTKALALESAARGITVNAVAPGYIDTDMVAAVPPEAMAKIVAQIPVGRLGHAEEIAEIVRYLASDWSAFVTGATFTANGGQYLD